MDSYNLSQAETPNLVLLRVVQPHNSVALAIRS